jgi:hypothetical protein
MILESTGYVTAFSIESVYDVGTALRQSRILPEARVSISRRQTDVALLGSSRLSPETHSVACSTVRNGDHKV